MKSGTARQIKLERIYSKEFEDFGRGGEQGRIELCSTRGKNQKSNVERYKNTVFVQKESFELPDVEN